MTRKNKIYIHAVFWVIMVVSTVLELIPSIGKYTSGIIAGDYIIYLTAHISVFYIFYFLSGGKNTFTKNKFLLFLSGLFIILPVNLLFTYLYAYFISPDSLELKDKDLYLGLGKIYLSIFQPVIYYAIAGALLRFVIKWIESEMIRKEAEKKQISGELKLLRSQINPEFLNSSLNHIKALVSTQPKEAVSNIDDLSEIMSYMLYETSSEKVPLDDEINYIRNYIALQRSRFKTGFINFEVNGDPTGIFIPPLLFMPLLNIVFSNLNFTLQQHELNINIKIIQDELIFELTNPGGNNKINKTAIDNMVTADINRFYNIQYGNNYDLLSTKDNCTNYLRLTVKHRQS